MNCHVQSEFSSWPWLQFYPLPGRRLHVSDTSINVEEFARYQRRSAERELVDLVWACRERYLYAHTLLHPNGHPPNSLEDGASADLAELLYPWDLLCVIYRRRMFDGQLDIFAEQQGREFERWHTFKRRFVVEPILRSAGWTRTVLDATGLLRPEPGSKPDAIDTLFLCLTDNIERSFSNDDPAQY